MEVYLIMHVNFSFVSRPKGLLSGVILVQLSLFEIPGLIASNRGAILLHVKRRPFVWCHSFAIVPIRDSWTHCLKNGNSCTHTHRHSGPTRQSLGRQFLNPQPQTFWAHAAVSGSSSARRRARRIPVPNRKPLWPTVSSPTTCPATSRKRPRPLRPPTSHPRPRSIHSYPSHTPPSPTASSTPRSTSSRRQLITYRRSPRLHTAVRSSDRMVTVTILPFSAVSGCAGDLGEAAASGGGLHSLHRRARHCAPALQGLLGHRRSR